MPTRHRRPLRNLRGQVQTKGRLRDCCAAATGHAPRSSRLRRTAVFKPGLACEKRISAPRFSPHAFRAAAKLTFSTSFRFVHRLAVVAESPEMPHFGGTSLAHWQE